MNVTKGLVLLLSLALVAGCANRPTVEERRQAIQDMKQEVLGELYANKPDVRTQITEAPGYGVFSNANVKLLLASFGGGYGVLTDNKTGRDTYMRVGEVGLGLGLGVKDFRVVMVFHSQEALDRFREYGFTFGAEADAIAQASETGGALKGEAIADNVTVYQLTQAGLALQASITGAKFWQADDLNLNR